MAFGVYYPKTTEEVPPLVVGSDQPLVGLDCSHQPYDTCRQIGNFTFFFNRLCSCAGSSYIVLLAGGGRKFDVEAASAAATITDTVLGRNSSDTLLGDGSGVISGEITGVEASEKPDEGILGNSSSAKIFRERKRGLFFSRSR